MENFLVFLVFYDYNKELLWPESVAKPICFSSSIQLVFVYTRRLRAVRAFTELCTRLISERGEEVQRGIPLPVSLNCVWEWNINAIIPT